ncbi:MAG: hypothetical protein WCT24_00150 [Patescibacteria group bacterium]
MRKLLAIFGMTALLLPSICFAQIEMNEIGLTETGTGIYGTNTTSMDIGTFIGTRIISPLLALLGVIFLVLVIYAGFMWMTAGGETAAVKKAKDILTNAVIGLVLVIIAYAATQFIITALTAWM